MASPNSVRVVEVCKVAPVNSSPDSAATKSSLPLTFLDTRYFKFPPAERIYFFRLTGLTPNFFRSVVLPRLKRSLSQTLLHFLPLAGHLTWPSDSAKPIILYTPNDAVSLTVVESDADFDLLASDEIKEAAESRSCVAELPISDTEASVIALQITLFPNKGFSIAITMHHSVLDGKSASMFLKSWALICKETEDGKILPDLLPELTPFFDRSVIKDRDDLESFYLNHWVASSRSNSESDPRSLKLLSNLLGVQSNLVRATFQLSHENIEKLRGSILSDRQDQFHPSTFAITYAYVSVCLMKVKGGDFDRKVYFLVAADCRSRLDPPIPENYFGNCVFVYDTVLEAGDFMNENGVAIITEKLCSFIQGLSEKKGLFQGAKESHERLRSAGPEVQKFGVAGSHRFKYYEEDFGWGKPEKVEIASIDRINAISFMESRYGNGVEIGVALHRHEMEAFASLFAQGLKAL